MVRQAAELVMKVGAAYLLAGIPIGAFALMGRMSPVYALPRRKLLHYWSWGALAVAEASILLAMFT
jgi:hypothetical protein